MVLVTMPMCDCARPNAGSAQDVALAQLPPEVRDVWKTQHDYLVRIVKGERFDGGDFTSAIDFFEAVTGLEAHDNKSYVGRLPNDQLEADLRAWDDWLQANASCLRWNPSRRSVECVPPQSSVAPTRAEARSSHHEV